MPSFVRLELFTEVACGSGVRVADFGPRDLGSCVLKQSITGEEKLTFSISRVHDKASAVLHGRIVRPAWSDTTLDTEWRIADIQDRSGTGDTGELVVTCQAPYLDLARAAYVAHDSAGRPTFDFSAAQLTATQWLTNYVVAACARLPYTVAVGTVDFSNTFDLSGDFATALEIVRAIQQPGRAPGDFVFRRNGSTDYKLDLLASRGSTANTVRVQTRRNLLACTRKRTLANLGTRIVPRGKQGSATRDLSQTYWKVTVVNGTTFDLSDPYGGTGPIAFDDQLNDLYVARIASTFSSQQITDSVASNQRCTVASTAGWSTGDMVRLFTTSGSAGKRLISLAHPTRVTSPASGGYGPVERILDFQAGFGDANLLTSNAWLNTWTTSSNPPDGFGRSSTIGGTWSRDTTVLSPVGNTYSQKIANGTTSANVETTRFYSPTATPYTTSGLRFCASAWYYCDTVSAALKRWVRIRIMKPDLSVSYADGDLLDPGEIVGQWVKLSVSNVGLSSATAGVVVVVEVYVDNDPNGYAYHTSYFGPMTLSESDVPIEDVLYSGGIAMWQRANTLLSTISQPIAGYDVELADLARIDGSDWNAEPLVVGGTIEVTDTDLSVTTSQRVVELEQDLLNPLNARVQLQTPEPLLTSALAGTVQGSTISGQLGGVTVNVTGAKATTLAGYGITDAYTATEIDALLAAKMPIGAAGHGGGTPLTIGSFVYTSGGADQTVSTGVAAVPVFNSQIVAGAQWITQILEVSGIDNATGDTFLDVLYLYGNTVGYGHSVISSTTLLGTPRARTWSMPTTLRLALGGAAGSTYTIRIGVRRASTG